MSPFTILIFNIQYMNLKYGQYINNKQDNPFKSNVYYCLTVTCFKWIYYEHSMMKSQNLG